MFRTLQAGNRRETTTDGWPTPNVRRRTWGRVARLTRSPVLRMQPQLPGGRLRGQGRQRQGKLTLRDLEPAARAMGLEIPVLNASNGWKINAAFATLVSERPDALFVSLGPLFTARKGRRVSGGRWKVTTVETRPDARTETLTKTVVPRLRPWEYRQVLWNGLKITIPSQRHTL
jgi:hypothetical protein